MDLSPQERDLLARTIYGEANKEPFEGKLGVAAVALNRLRSGRFGKSMADVVLAPKQFEPWDTRARELLALAPDSPDYRVAQAAIDAALAGEDPTKGATHFFAPKAQAALKRRQPSWAKGEPMVVIGGHHFFAPEGAQDAISKALGEPSGSGSALAFSPGDRAPAARPAAPAADLLGSWGAPAAADKSGDLLGTWTVTGASQATSKPAAAPVAAPAAATAPRAEGVDETLPQAVNRWVAENPGDTWKERAVRTGAGVVRGIGDVSDTLAQGIVYGAEKGANALASVGSAGLISQETAGAVRDWSARVRSDIAAGNAGFEAAAGDSALAGAGRIGGQIIGTAPLLGAGGTAIRATGVLTPAAGRPVVNALVTGAGSGAGAAALTSSASDQPLSSQITTGGIVGGALGPAGYAAARAGRGIRNMLFGATDRETAQLAQAARNTYGIPVTAGQISNAPSTRFLDSVLQRLPFSGYGSRTVEQQAAFNRAVSNTFGEDAPKITMGTIRDARDRIGQAFDDVANRTGNIRVDRPFIGRAQTILDDARSVLPASEVNVIEGQLRSVFETIDRRAMTIDARSYQALTRKDAPLSRAQQSKDPNIRFYANQIRDALDDVMQRSAPADAVADLLLARSQWKALKTVEPLAKKATTGDISPALLMGGVNRSYAGAGGELGELGRIGQRFIKEPPSSGTSERLLAMHGIGAGLGALGLGGAYAFDPENFQRNTLMAAGALAAGRGGSAVLRSNSLAESMIRGGLRLPPTNALARNISRAAPAAALTYRGSDRQIGQ